MIDKLSEPTPLAAIEWRIQSSGKSSNGSIWARCIPFIDARYIQSRLDKLILPGNWSVKFYEGFNGGVVCGLSIRIRYDDGTVAFVEKQDGAPPTDIEGFKGSLSGAFRRAAVMWGIGRDLYDVGDCWAVVGPNGKFQAKTKDGTSFRWSPPLKYDVPAVGDEPPDEKAETNGHSAQKSLPEIATPTDWQKLTKKALDRIRDMNTLSDLDAAESAVATKGYPAANMEKIMAAIAERRLALTGRDRAVAMLEKAGFTGLKITQILSSAEAASAVKGRSVEEIVKESIAAN